MHRPCVLNEVDQVCFEMQKHCTVAAILVEGLDDEFFEVRSSGVGVRLKTRVS